MIGFFISRVRRNIICASITKLLALLSYITSMMQYMLDFIMFPLPVYVDKHSDESKTIGISKSTRTKKQL